jgi:pimeloyl-ACP methyl ester carboxylesterase
MTELAECCRVFVVDLPGCGETPPLDDPTPAAFVRFLWEVCDALGISEITILGLGFGSALAIGMAQARPTRVRRLALAGCFLGDPAMREQLRASFVPTIAIVPDGAHWFRTWQMLRDGEIWWPWYAQTRAALRRVAGDFAAQTLHRRTCEVMRQPGGYAAIVNSALQQSVSEAIASLKVPVVFVRGASNPLATAYDARAETLFQDIPWLPLGELV